MKLALIFTFITLTISMIVTIIRINEIRKKHESQSKEFIIEEKLEDLKVV